jgi:integrase
MNFHSHQKLSKALENFRKECPEDYDIVYEFASDLIAEGISEYRVRSYVIWLKKIIQTANKRLKDFEKVDVKRAINHYQLLRNSGEVSESSVFEIKKTLKKFFKWYGKNELVSWFSVGNVKNNLSPSDLITEEEFQKMLNACTNSRDRALISLLYESGARIGEVGSMRVKDVSFDEYGAIVWLPKSKTIRRKLRIVYSARYLSEWLSDHPLKDDPESPLWIKLTGKKRLQAMEYKDVQWQLKKIAKRAGIKKRIYPHLFRHTRATRLLSRVPETIGAKYMGWVNGSKMVGVYVHLASEDVDEAILRMHGIKTNGNGKDLEVKQCPRCLQVNPATSRFCSRCGLPLTEEAIQEVEEWEKRKNEALNELTNPQFIKLFMGMQREIEMLKAEIEKLRNESRVKGVKAE